MKWIERYSSFTLTEKIQTRPVVLLTGIRQSGKSSLLQRLFHSAEYITFDHFRNAEYAETNPEEFLASFKDKQVILDEIQYVPRLFRELKIVIDRERTVPAKWILTGSQKFPLLESARESLAGRIGLHELHTLSASELRTHISSRDMNDLLWKGGFPEIWTQKEMNPTCFLDDYITTYLEKDLRNIINTPHLRDFYRFLRSCSLRVGSLVNYADLSRDSGISPNTAKSWLNTLVRAGLIELLEPWFSNVSKRFVKTPKLYFTDQGLLCRLLNINSFSDMLSHGLCESIWENFVFNELVRMEDISSSRNLFFYRDQNMVEVDFLLEKSGCIQLIEAKFAEQPGKTNLKKAAAVPGVLPEHQYCACRIPESGLFSQRSGMLFNPLFISPSSVLA